MSISNAVSTEALASDMLTEECYPSTSPSPQRRLGSTRTAESRLRENDVLVDSRLRENDEFLRNDGVLRHGGVLRNDEFLRTDSIVDLCKACFQKFY